MKSQEKNIFFNEYLMILYIKELYYLFRMTINNKYKKNNNYNYFH